jgi:hypothetical protein
LALPTVIAIAKPNAILFPIVSSRDMIWNAIATDQDRIFVAGPRWTGGKGPAVAVFDRKGHPQPYPNNAWNSWTPGADTTRAFVSVNALHRDDRGGSSIPALPISAAMRCRAAPRRSASSSQPTGSTGFICLGRKSCFQAATSTTSAFTAIMLI